MEALTATHLLSTSSYSPTAATTSANIRSNEQTNHVKENEAMKSFDFPSPGKTVETQRKRKSPSPSGKVQRPPVQEEKSSFKKFRRSSLGQLLAGLSSSSAKVAESDKKESSTKKREGSLSSCTATAADSSSSSSNLVKDDLQMQCPSTTSVAVVGGFPRFSVPSMFQLFTGHGKPILPISTLVDRDSDPTFLKLTELSSEDLGGKVIFATDEWFAEGSNLLKASEAVFKPDIYTECGKWMDGWESRRRRKAGHDFVIIELGLAGIPRGITIDTSHFTGNYAPFASVECLSDPNLTSSIASLDLCKNVGKIGTEASAEDIHVVNNFFKGNKDAGGDWVPLVPMTKMDPGYPGTNLHYFQIDQCEGRIVTHVKLNMFPDGGIARFRLYGEVFRKPLELVKAVAADFPEGFESPNNLIDLLSVRNGAVSLCWSDQHFGCPKNLLMPNRAPNMGSGWETARKPMRSHVLLEDASGKITNLHGDDWCVLKLAKKGTVEVIEVDTNHFKGNFPESVTLQGCCRPDLFAKDVLKQTEWFDNPRNMRSVSWKTILPRTKLNGHQRRMFIQEDCSLENFDAEDAVVVDVKDITHLRVTMFPDGGLSRIRLYGRGNSNA
eukprot:TRINITY_DN104876_c0_g1_i1.p1 TRINITY_DN104876_c0_g1~~TRINITY_DN104876_c0_g1_i1.p1  ORF type:complete len:610 (-),score=64.80 TRINITY_DN104876_c0_g1_i1:261-2090(-)